MIETNDLMNTQTEVNGTAGIVHMKIVVETEYDYNVETKEVTNVVSRVLDGAEAAKKRTRTAKEKVETPKAPTIEDLAQQHPIATMRKSGFKFTREAANLLGCINEAGEVYQTPNGKNCRIKIGFKKYEERILPCLSVEFDDNPSSASVLTDGLTLNCSGMARDVIGELGATVFFLKKEGEMVWMIPCGSLEEAIGMGMDGKQEENTNTEISQPAQEKRVVMQPKKREYKKSDPYDGGPEISLATDSHNEFIPDFNKKEFDETHIVNGNIASEEVSEEDVFDQALKDSLKDI